MKKILAIALVLVMVVSCCSVMFASAAETDAEPFWITHYDDNTPEGAGIIMTETDTTGEWNDHYAFKPIDGVKNGYELVDFSYGTIAGDDTSHNGAGYALEVPAGGFVYSTSEGNDYPSLGMDGPNYVNDSCKAQVIRCRTWEKGDKFIITGLDLEGKKVPTTTSDKNWYEDGYVCTATIAPYDPNAQTGGDESKEPEYVDVEEVINVDGKLDDTGWTKATFNKVDAKNGKIQSGSDLGSFEYSYAVRSDDKNVYVAIKTNAGVKSVDTSLDGFDAIRVTGTGLRLYIEVDDATKKFDRLVDVLVEDGKAVGYLAKEKTDAYTVAMVTGDNETVFEFALSIEKMGIKDSFKMAVSYCGVFGETFDVLNDHMYDTNDDAPWAVDTHYTTYKVADFKLGSYKEPVTPDPAEPTYAEKIEALLGDKIENADFEISLTSSVEKNAEGKLIMTAVLTVSKINENVKMLALNATVRYDAERMTLTNGTVAKGEDKNSLDCVTKKPTDWENLTPNANNQKKEGEIEVSVVNPNDSTPYLTLDDNVVLTFTFELKAGYTEAAVWVVNGEVTSLYEPNPEVDTDEAAEYVGNGDYTVGSYVEETPSAPESSEPASSATAPTGDAGILVFAVLGILAVAGAATVIKVRH